MEARHKRNINTVLIPRELWVKKKKIAWLLTMLLKILSENFTTQFCFIRV